MGNYVFVLSYLVTIFFIFFFCLVSRICGLIAVRASHQVDDIKRFRFRHTCRSRTIFALYHQLGDIITRIDDELISDSQRMVDVVSRRLPGQEVRLDVRRGVQKVQLRAVLAEFEMAPLYISNGTTPAATIWYNLDDLKQ